MQIFYLLYRIRLSSTIKIWDHFKGSNVSCEQSVPYPVHLVIEPTLQCALGRRNDVGNKAPDV